MGFNSAFKGLREEHGMRVFKNRLLQKILGPKREEAKEELIQLHK